MYLRARRQGEMVICRAKLYEAVFVQLATDSICLRRLKFIMFAVDMVYIFIVW